MENIKAKIQGILMNSSQKSVIGWSLEEDDFEAVAEEIVKSCFIHSVSQQRELFYNFITWYNAIPKVDKPKNGLITTNIIEKYLKL